MDDDDEGDLAPTYDWPEPTVREIFEFDLSAAIANHLLADDDLARDAKTWTTGAANRIRRAIMPTIDKYTTTREAVAQES